MNPLDATSRAARVLAGDSEVCETCGSRVTGLCRPLSEAALDEVMGEAEQIALGPRATLFQEGEKAAHVFTLVQGTAKLTRLLPDGREQVLGFRFAGDIIGYTTGETYPFAVQLLTGAKLCRIERPKLEELMRRLPALERRLLDLCIQELAATQDQLVSVGRRPAEARLAAFLLQLGEAGKRRLQVGTQLDMPMTRADIADFLGLTLETVSRSFTAFRRRGWVREPAHNVVEILKPQALHELVEGVPFE
jgi:CRP/FNR family transcriptional regulator